MFSPRDLRFALCSLELDVLRAQRIIGFFFHLHYPQINEVGKSGKPIRHDNSNLKRSVIFVRACDHESLSVCSDVVVVIGVRHLVVSVSGAEPVF